MSNDTGGPAFPSTHHHGQEEGMTLRDYFATKAMQGMLADSNISGTPAEFAIRAYAIADAMLKERG